MSQHPKDMEDLQEIPGSPKIHKQYILPAQGIKKR